MYEPIGQGKWETPYHVFTFVNPSLYKDESVINANELIATKRLTVIFM